MVNKLLPYIMDEISYISNKSNPASFGLVFEESNIEAAEMVASMLIVNNIFVNSSNKKIDNIFEIEN